MVAIDHPITGPQRQVGPLLEMSKTRPGIARPSAMLGQHTDEVLREAGYTDEEIAALRADGVVR
jgi:formyl-CoA transferase